MLQRDGGALAAPPGPGEWSAGSVSSEQLSLELHHVEREIGKRTREIAMVSAEREGAGAGTKISPKFLPPLSDLERDLAVAAP